jgi:fucose 4-O-acetylase-like acetyltransferase
VAALTASGAGLIPLALFIDRVSLSLYPVYDFWWTSPSYFLVKLGILLLVLGFAYAWDRVPGWSPLRQMGRASLVIYWVHIEIVYGGNVLRWAHGTLSVTEASIGLALLILAMLLLSIVRTQGPKWLGRSRVPVAA